MTDTAPIRTEATPKGDPRSDASVDPRPKVRRSPLLIPLGIAVVILGAVIGVTAFRALTDTEAVLTVRESIPRGQTITAGDLTTVEVGVDPALHPLLESDQETVVGKQAATDIVAGGVITSEQITTAVIPQPARSVVGLSLAAAMMPADLLHYGDPVRVVTTPNQQQAAALKGDPDSVPATVVGVTKDQVTGNTVVNVEVDSSEAPGVAARAAAGNVALVLDAAPSSTTSDTESTESAAPEADSSNDADPDNAASEPASDPTSDE